LRAQDAEECIPLPSLAYFGLDSTVEAAADAIAEERASCLFVRRVVDERRRVSSCFSSVADPRPPPPPEMSSKSRSAELSLRLQRGRLGDLEQYAAPRKTDRAEWAVQTQGALDGTQALIDALGENDPILRGLLTDTLAEIQAAGEAGEPGRRLLERGSYELKMTDALIEDPLTEIYGRDGIPGVTVGSCEALCEAARQDANRTNARQCGTLTRTLEPCTHWRGSEGVARSASRRVRLQARGALLVRRPHGLVLAAAARGRVQDGRLWR